LFGWGGWGRSRVYDENGSDITIQDGLWIIVLGMNGLWGLSMIMTAMALPVWRCMRRLSRSMLAKQQTILLLGACAVCPIQAIDLIASNFPSPINLVASGGVIGFAAIRPKQAHHAPQVLKSGGLKGA